jgi:hypothetical protein
MRVCVSCTGIASHGSHTGGKWTGNRASREPWNFAADKENFATITKRVEAIVAIVEGAPPPYPVFILSLFFCHPLLPSVPPSLTTCGVCCAVLCFAVLCCAVLSQNQRAGAQTRRRQRREGARRCVGVACADRCCAARRIHVLIARQLPLCVCLCVHGHVHVPALRCALLCVCLVFSPCLIYMACALLT